jgi:hypothetical protein
MSTDTFFSSSTTGFMKAITHSNSSLEFKVLHPALWH